MLFNKISHLLDSELFDEARSLIRENLKENDSDLSYTDFMFQVKLICFLTDLGRESKNESDLIEAVNYFEFNEEKLKTLISQSSYYYNIANAKQGIADIFYFNNRGIHPITTIKDKLQPPINYYWLAYKSLETTDDNLRNRILINISTSLIAVGRIVESLQYLDLVLRKDPNYPQALTSRGAHLSWLINVTNCSVTTALYTQIYYAHNKALLTNLLPPSIERENQVLMQEALSIIRSHGFDVEEIEEEIRVTKNEYDNHTQLRKFSIDNFLTLNEHSIYCNCVAAEKDELQIGVQHGEFNDRNLPKLELLLNRMKSEFAFARYSYYSSLQSENPIDNDTKFSELLDGEVISGLTEMQRTSFRICYGILDKIALGICKLYNLNSKNIYFDKFWEDKKRRDDLTHIKNLHLNALYSIACDLGPEGELKQFKDWRNKLEHNLLVLKRTNNPDFDILKIFEDKEFVTVVDQDEFRKKTLHLLQLTRSAIFSFVYCVRLQTIQGPSDNSGTNGFVVGFKE